MMIDPAHAAAWLALGKLCLDTLRSAFGLRPTGADAGAPTRRDAAALGRALINARLARDLGYRLCRCEFPPKPMLWDNAAQAFVCQNAACRRTEDAL